MYLAHGLMMERIKRPGEARQKFELAMALGSTDLALKCSLARLGGQVSPGPKCECAAGLRELLAPACPVTD